MPDLQPSPPLSGRTALVTEGARGSVGGERGYLIGDTRYTAADRRE